MHTKKRLRRSMALRSNKCARHCLTAASERHGLTMMSNKWGGYFCLAPAARQDGLNSVAHDGLINAHEGLTRPASECRAGRSGVAVCQGEKGHCVGG